MFVGADMFFISLDFDGSGFLSLASIICPKYLILVWINVNFLI